MSAYVLAIDQGTTNSKAVLLNKTGRIAARSAVQVPVSYPQPGWVEQSLEEIWNTVLAAVDQCLAQVNGPQIAAIGISNQRESVALWDRSSGTPIGPCITWQCRRSAERIDRIRNSQTEVLVSSKTGLGLDPLFPAAKIGWLLDNTPRARALLKNDMLCTGTVDTWLLFKLTGGGTYATDAGNASRTQLFDITTKRWDDELCELFEVPKKILPRVMSSDATFGVTAGVGRLVAGIPIRSVMGDSHAALFGHGIRHTGEAKATYGTGSSLMALTDIPIRSRFGLSSTIAWQRGTDVAYALEGNISVSAQAAAWVAELLGLPNVESLTELATTVSDSDGVVVVPAFAGLGAPHWKDRVRAVIAGMSLSTKRAHVARATLEAIALQVRDVFTAMEADLGIRLAQLSVDGGATLNDTLMQIQADILGRRVRRHAVTELSAAGTGVLAGIASGFWTDGEGLSILSKPAASFDPLLEETARQRTIGMWNEAIHRATKDVPGERKSWFA